MLVTNDKDLALSFQRNLWIAQLSDGQTVYSDDDNPAHETSSAWLRLKQFLSETGLKIEQLSLESGGYVVELPKSDYGYSIVRGFAVLDVTAVGSQSKSFPTITYCRLFRDQDGCYWERTKFKSNGLVIIQQDEVSYDKYMKSAIING
jgi:hypothetical protein